MSIPKIYTDETAARKHLESLQWPDGPVCPHCGVVDNAKLLAGKSTRPGVYKCRDCEKPFSVTVGTVFERSHIPLHKWLYAVHLLTASKKGHSSHQLHRVLGVTYKTAWFMSHRIREAFRPIDPSALGGTGKTVESDETYIGKAEGHEKAKGKDHKNIVLTLVERGGAARSFHIESTTLNEVARIVRTNLSRKSHLMTDEAMHYRSLGKEFDRHGSVVHSNYEYVRRERRMIDDETFTWDSVHTNTVEGFYSIFKRGMKGIYQHCAEKHLHRYLAEFDFRYNNRIRLGINDAMRADNALKGIRGKRLTYASPRKAHVN